MPARISNAAERLMLGKLLNKEFLNVLELELFVNDVIPPETDTNIFNTYSFPSYDATSGDRQVNNWTITEGEPTTATHPSFSLKLAAAYTVYGYVLYPSGYAWSVFAERFATPFSVTGPNDEINLTISVTLSDLVE